MSDDTKQPASAPDPPPEPSAPKQDFAPSPDPAVDEPMFPMPTMEHVTADRVIVDRKPKD
jgi:hypothetical protein